MAMSKAVGTAVKRKARGQKTAVKNKIENIIHRGAERGDNSTAAAADNGGDDSAGVDASGCGGSCSGSVGDGNGSKNMFISGQQHFDWARAIESVYSPEGAMGADGAAGGNGCGGSGAGGSGTGVGVKRVHARQAFARMLPRVSVIERQRRHLEYTLTRLQAILQQPDNLRPLQTPFTLPPPPLNAGYAASTSAPASTPSSTEAAETEAAAATARRRAHEKLADAKEQAYHKLRMVLSIPSFAASSFCRAPDAATLGVALELAGQAGVGIISSRRVLQGAVGRAQWETHWREEWAVLTPSTLTFYRSRSRKPAISVSLLDIRSIGDLPAGQHPFVGFHFFQVETLGRVHYVCTASSVEKRNWLQGIEQQMRVAMSRADAKLLLLNNSSRESFIAHSQSGRWCPSGRLVLNSKRMLHHPHYGRGSSSSSSSSSSGSSGSSGSSSSSCRQAPDASMRHPCDIIAGLLRQVTALTANSR